MCYSGEAARVVDTSFDDTSFAEMRARVVAVVIYDRKIYIRATRLLGLARYSVSPKAFPLRIDSLPCIPQGSNPGVHYRKLTQGGREAGTRRGCFRPYTRKVRSDALSLPVDPR